MGDTFERSETIEVAVTFNEAVDVSGTPQLALGIGSQTRQAKSRSTSTHVYPCEPGRTTW